jgi:hypothetical protein
LTLTLLLLTVLMGCKPTIDLSGYGNTPIEISGLTAEAFSVTPNELAELELSSASASGTSAKAGTVKATGPTLRTLTEHYGANPEDFKLVRFIAKDGYRVTLHENGIRNWSVILSIAPLTLPEQPLRLLIPDADSSQWVYGVVRIEFERV